MIAKKKKSDKKKPIRRSAASRALRKIFAQQGVEIEIDFVYRLLAFGALASKALLSDTENSKFGGPQLAAAAVALASSTAANFTANAKNYLTLLKFPPDFVTNIMPWTQISPAGIKAMEAILEPDAIDYDDGGCYEAVEATLAAIAGIGS